VSGAHVSGSQAKSDSIFFFGIQRLSGFHRIAGRIKESFFRGEFEIQKLGREAREHIEKVKFSEHSRKPNHDEEVTE
jgi:hypothetical protein